MEQLSFFDEESSIEKVEFLSYYCNEDWSVKTETIEGFSNIVVYDILKLTKAELIEICRKAESSKKSGPYGYKVFYIEDGVKRKIFVRFHNYKAKVKWGVIEFINLYFDKK